VVDRAVRVGEDDGQGQVVIEGVEAQIDIVDVRDANADVVSGQVPEGLRRTDNLPVEQTTVNSGFASKHDEDRPVLGPGEEPGFIEIVQPVEAGPLLQGRPRLRRDRRSGEKPDHEENAQETPRMLDESHHPHLAFGF